jgi:very-short-patch-repair endonuclease
VVRDGVRVSALVELFVELAEELSLVELVVAGDWMVRRHRVRTRDLRRVAMAARGPHARLARQAARYVRAKVDSPMESRLRMLIVLAGMPEPVVNMTVRMVDGRKVRRFDLCWPEVRVVVEYDGRHHVEIIEQWESDLDRREEIDDDEWRILVVVASGIYVDPARTVHRIFRLLERRGLDGLPERPSEDWRPHFPGRPVG